MKKTPERMCVACRTMRDKRELVRIVRNKDGEIFPDFTGKAAGRGAYVCKSAECLAKCRKTRALSRAFSCNVDDAVYSRIGEELFGSEK